MVSQAHKNATKTYRAKSLKNMSLTFSQHDTESYAALCELEKVYGSASGAIKAALIAHAKSLKS
ncbi:hypothetical protein B0181_11870 [Moraxella caviae]|uniref:Uncharacterized protein n=1 Tax=Moraxella caviae TaxID=34060 RepID=A0A1S9ZR71_9GAMM|nr:hypothetical protein [Moraxella caviae]OOR85868.1 hypothetical protein B0181_11870 [Moraxella caviae]STZ14479.1 Uncharacterised protein [Moraxella caviae]